MLTDIELANFKSVQSDEIPLKPLTIFTGPNSSGKSNIMQAIAIISQIAKMAQRVQRTFPQHLEDRNAEYYWYPQSPIEYIVHKGELEREITIRTHLISRRSKRSIGYSIKYTSTPLSVEQVIYVSKRPQYHTHYYVTPSGSEFSVFRHPRIWEKEATKISANYPLTPGCFIPAKEEIGKTEARRGTDQRLRNQASGLVSELRDELGRVFLVSAPRGIISMETKSGPDPTWVGKNGQHLVYILAKIFGQRKYRSVQEKIYKWSGRFAIGGIAAGLRKGEMLGAEFEDPSLGSIFDMTSASYGSRQLLTVLTQIFWSDPSDTLLVEEPEISLHPESQVLIQELFAEAIGEGKQVICTTHSPFFILSLSNVVKQSKLSVSDVAVYHVEKKDEGTKTRSLEIDKRGFVRGWIPSYMEVENKLFEQWAEGFE